MAKLEKIMADMATLDPTLCYYAITLAAGRDGRKFVDTQTAFVNFADSDYRIEIRAASLVKPEWMIRGWTLLEQPYAVVKNDKQWLLFYLRGGNALVEQSIAHSHLRTTLVPSKCVRTMDFGPGFTSVGDLPKTALQRAPTPRFRMRVFNRDARKCRICGRCPRNHVDVELHTHHIRPWSSGGLTIEENLITLCHTCHKGLDPHFDRTLFDHLPRTQSATDFEDSVMRYRVQIFNELCELEQHKNSPRIRK